LSSYLLSISTITYTQEAAILAESAHDPALKHTLPFGIGIHHAGLDESDRNVVEELFGSGKLQVC
jgi:replicative superfamily II helicase